jgi:hypothetical protein
VVTIEVPTAYLNISPTMFHIYATQYYQCKQTFRHREPFSPVPYFLLCRAIELELKAKHLALKSRAEVKSDYGHNLTKSYDDLDATDKTLSAAEYADLKSASEIYNVKGFEYCTVSDAVTGFNNFPDIASLDLIAKKLIGNDA